METSSQRLTDEEKYRLLLEVSEAANSQVEIAAVLEAVVEGLEPAIHVDALAVTTLDGDHLVPHAVSIRGVERRQGDSFTDIMARWMRLSGGETPPKTHGSLPLAGTGTEHVGRTGRAWICQDLAQGTRFPEDSRLLAAGVRSYVRVPLKVRDRLVGSLAFSRREPGPFSPHEVDAFEALARPIAAAVANARAFEEIARLTGQLQAENLALRQEIDERSMFEEIIGSSKAAARDPGPGRQGGGHRHDGADHRRDRHRQGAGGAGHPPPLAAVAPRPGGGQLRRPPPSLIASELFGHEKGAFTGALQRRVGRFELAAGRLDLPRRGRRAAARGPGVAAAGAPGGDLRAGGRQPADRHRRPGHRRHQPRPGGGGGALGTFRNDLFYRLNVFPIDMPPLRQRREDIPILVEYFAARYAPRFGKRFQSIEKDSMDRILAYAWPGNVRELQNVIERAAILSDGEVLRVDEPLLSAGAGPSRRGHPPPPGQPARRGAAADRRGARPVRRPRLRRQGRRRPPRRSLHDPRIAHQEPGDRQVPVPVATLKIERPVLGFQGGDVADRTEAAGGS